MLKPRPSVDRIRSAKFAGVELHIEGKSDLTVLLAALQSRTSILFSQIGRRKSTIRAELKRTPKGNSAEAAVLSFAQIARRLPPGARVLWSRADRTFDVGFHGGPRPPFVAQTLGPKALQAAAQVGACLMITVYAPIPPARGTTVKHSRVQVRRRRSSARARAAA